ncbi:MAG TPA: hypothetical protein VME86_12240 [Acidobacteriaceae bacterium]|nr:hypothetical protein [Acidobacteriaceae bacterium]
MLRILKKYIFWTYERGSFHYDVMVTLILAFIFITPFLWNYGDRPQPDKLAAHSLIVRTAGPGQYVYDVPVSDVQRDGAAVEAQLRAQIESVSGPVKIDSIAPVKSLDGKVLAYRVRAHR